MPCGTGEAFGTREASPVFQRKMGEVPSEARRKGEESDVCRCAAKGNAAAIPSDAADKMPPTLQSILVKCGVI